MAWCKGRPVVAGPVCDLSCYINFRFRGVAFKPCITCNPKTIYNSLVIVTFVLAKETMRQQNIQIKYFPKASVNCGGYFNNNIFKQS
jgi:hypothetical protein